MNSTNQPHPFRFSQIVKTFRWIRCKPGQRFAIAGLDISTDTSRRENGSMIRRFCKFNRALLAGMMVQSLWLLPSDALAERTFQGRIVNGTTNRPAAQQKVELLTLGEGMNKNAEALSGPDGLFQFTITMVAALLRMLLAVLLHDESNMLSYV